MTLCAASKDVPFQDIEQVIRVMEVTHLNLTPTVAALIQPANVPGVRLLVTAGEALSTKVHRDWAGKGLYQGKLFRLVDQFIKLASDCPTRLRSK